MVENPYEILGVSPDASPDEVKKAYRKKARENHPDLNPDDPQAAERMNQINEAYDRIMNPEKYAAHDRRASSSGGASGAGGASTAGGYAGSGGQGRSGGGQSSGTGYGSGGGPYGWSFVDFDDLFGGAGAGYGSHEPIHPEASAGDSPQVRSAINDINAGRYKEAMKTLNAITSDGRDARWYYLSALANDGAGNTVMAQEQIRRAVRMDPNNRDYQQAQRQFQQSGQAYQQETKKRGFSLGIDPMMLCLFIWCCAPTLCNVCCLGNNDTSTVTDSVNTFSNMTGGMGGMSGGTSA